MSRCASSLLPGDICVMATSFHHGGRMYAAMCSMSGCVYSGKQTAVLN
jgi:hypothetical protein